MKVGDLVRWRMPSWLLADGAPDVGIVIDCEQGQVNEHSVYTILFNPDVRQEK